MDHEQRQEPHLQTAVPTSVILNESPVAGGMTEDGRLSDEWGSYYPYNHGIPCTLTLPNLNIARQVLNANHCADASKVPPSRFQKRKGSIYATPNSRDGHIDRNYADKYHAKIAERKFKK